MRDDELWARIERWSSSVGLGEIAAIGVEPFHFDAASVLNQRASGRHNGMEFTFRRPSRSMDVRVTFPYAESIIVVTYPYPREAGEGVRSIAAYATRDRYSELRDHLGGIRALLKEAGYRAQVVADDNALMDRVVARRAGLGWVGKSSMILNPRSGPHLLIGSVVTNWSYRSHRTLTLRECGTCDACVRACPTGALDGEGHLDARRCLAWLLQKPGTFPTEYREAVGVRVYGCDTCLDACPVGKRNVEVAEEGPSSLEVLRKLLELSDESLIATYPHFYVPRRQAAHLRRNVLLAAGNLDRWDDAIAAGLRRYVCSSDPVLAEQARWSLRRYERLGRTRAVVS